MLRHRERSISKNGRSEWLSQRVDELRQTVLDVELCAEQRVVRAAFERMRVGAHNSIRQHDSELFEAVRLLMPTVNDALHTNRPCNVNEGAVDKAKYRQLWYCSFCADSRNVSVDSVNERHPHINMVTPASVDELDSSMKDLRELRWRT
jgi:hypothetical protein